MSGEGFGSVTMWGFSPAIDLQEDLCLSHSKEETIGNNEAVEVVNILVVGAGDCRHLLKTMALRNRHKRRKLHIYVIENNLELLGRHLLLLTLSLEPSHRMGLQEKVELFAELYGNTLVRQQTVQYLQDKASLFVEMITDLDYSDERMPTIDLSQLKYKERDYLEGIFKFWKEPDMKFFNVLSMWDSRLRQYLTNRYDSRKGAYDWDLSMKLHEMNAKVMTKHEYFRWRENGVAFEGREGIYDQPNKSMASGIILKKRNGEKVPCRGYWGDMVTGPFIGFGIDTTEESLLKTVNGKPSNNSEDITFHNLLSLFHELQTGTPYVKSEDPPDSKITEVDESSMEEGSEEFAQGKEGNREFYAPIACEEVCMHFLPLNSVSDLPKKAKFKNLFNSAFISASMVQVLNPALSQIFADQATLNIELVKYILDLSKPQVAGFSERVGSMAAEAGFVPLESSQTTNDCFARFTKE